MRSVVIASRSLVQRTRDVQAMDHPTNGELAEHARHFFEQHAGQHQVFVRTE